MHAGSRERLPISDPCERELANALTNRRVHDFHSAVSLRGPDVDERGVFDASLAAAARIIVGAPQVGLEAALLQEELLGIRMKLAAHSDSAGLDIDHVLDHVLEECSRKACQLSRVDLVVQQEDVWRALIHAEGGYPRGPPLSTAMQMETASGSPL